jgi:N-methylhydantoinase A/oxoprolinase/acetone carboxylase beta subunit
MKYCIGIDTGGTYTDAVLLEQETGKVVHWVKEPTTHRDVSIGVGNALSALFTQNIQTSAITSLAVSTTLATNAIVENQGARVGLFVLGYVRHFKLPVIANIFLKGGHDITGKEEQPLDMESLVDTLLGLKGEVDSYAVCGAMSMENPAHELVAEEAISLIDPKPVFCSHRVSSHAGMRERAATACLHAKLQPLMLEFLASIQRSMIKVGLSCPVTIICGDGRGASLDEVAERAAITMASGPAATARFGATAGEERALVVDVGGTTTDVCMLKDGQPVMNDDGCRIDQWQTHVESIDMYTAAGGGDSHVVCDEKGGIILLPARVQPLATTPDLPDPAGCMGCGRRNSLILPVRDAISPEETDSVLLALIEQGALTPRELAKKCGVSGITLEKRIERLLFLQKIEISGFTPTDALHVLGRLDIGDTAAAVKGAEALAAELDCSVESLCEQTLTLTEKTIEKIILDYIGRSIWGEQQATPFLANRDNELFSVNFSVKLPLIGIGAAARAFLPGVAKRLQTSVAFPELCETGNAIGAALIGLESVSS